MVSTFMMSNNQEGTLDRTSRNTSNKNTKSSSSSSSLSEFLETHDVKEKPDERNIIIRDDGAGGGPSNNKSNHNKTSSSSWGMLLSPSTKSCCSGDGGGDNNDDDDDDGDHDSTSSSTSSRDAKNPTRGPLLLSPLAEEWGSVRQQGTTTSTMYAPKSPCSMKSGGGGATSFKLPINIIPTFLTSASQLPAVAEGGRGSSQPKMEEEHRGRTKNLTTTTTTTTLPGSADSAGNALFAKMMLAKRYTLGGGGAAGGYGSNITKRATPAQHQTTTRTTRTTNSHEGLLNLVAVRGEDGGTTSNTIIMMRRGLLLDDPSSNHTSGSNTSSWRSDNASWRSQAHSCSGNNNNNNNNSSSSSFGTIASVFTRKLAPEQEAKLKELQELTIRASSGHSPRNKDTALPSPDMKKVILRHDATSPFSSRSVPSGAATTSPSSFSVVKNPTMTMARKSISPCRGGGGQRRTVGSLPLRYKTKSADGLFEMSRGPLLGGAVLRTGGGSSSLTGTEQWNSSRSQEDLVKKVHDNKEIQASRRNSKKKATSTSSMSVRRLEDAPIEAEQLAAMKALLTGDTTTPHRTGGVPTISTTHKSRRSSSKPTSPQKNSGGNCDEIKEVRRNRSTTDLLSSAHRWEATTPDRALQNRKKLSTSANNNTTSSKMLMDLTPLLQGAIRTHDLNFRSSSKPMMSSQISGGGGDEIKEEVRRNRSTPDLLSSSRVARWEATTPDRAIQGRKKLSASKDPTTNTYNKMMMDLTPLLQGGIKTHDLNASRWTTSYALEDPMKSRNLTRSTSSDRWNVDASHRSCPSVTRGLGEPFPRNQGGEDNSDSARETRSCEGGLGEYLKKKVAGGPGPFLRANLPSGSVYSKHSVASRNTTTSSSEWISSSPEALAISALMKNQTGKMTSVKMLSRGVGGSRERLSESLGTLRRSRENLTSVASVEKAVPFQADQDVSLRNSTWGEQKHPAPRNMFDIIINPRSGSDDDNADTLTPRSPASCGSRNSAFRQAILRAGSTARAAVDEEEELSLADSDEESSSCSSEESPYCSDEESELVSDDEEEENQDGREDDDDEEPASISGDEEE